ncbi:ABC transporter substrate-binding protein [Variovorax terrae]|uniref:ABC transporter substrate-binding protein n=1 Tax=Variovorax terrae TaxID=2923278 RepID=A0A9X2ARR3_9BURK|nr:ABC transporter substrate-binding protein [Variovorax terrae]MCJ0764466.1 ABC transporter substrate-binding protein [Variovorax terrae]
MSKFRFAGVTHLLAAAVAVTLSLGANAQDKVTFALNWKAQASQGGFFQAAADGTYKKYGLDVEIQQGGPQVNNRPMLPAGKIDFLLTGGLLTALETTRAKIPTVVVAAFFQKDPTALITHAGQYKNFAELKGAKTVLIAKSNQFGFWQWLKAEHGFSDEQFKPYTYSLAPFLADKNAVQQAFATAEPIYAEEQGVKTDIYMLADVGYNTYGNMVETRRDLVEKNPELVRRFVEASIVGWYNFLYADRKPAMEMIKRLNPELNDAKLEAEFARVKNLGLVDSGESLTSGIGAINQARIQDFAARMTKAGVYKPGEVDPNLVATDRFVNKKIGMDIKAAAQKK